ncbi:MAG: 3'-5' exonuclease, partial [Opitutus sp.]|nr:3'-5' exonuclease [Opitutus sp.]
VVTLHGGAITTTRTRTCAAIGRVAPEDVAVHGLEAASVAADAPFADEWEYFARLRESGPLAAHFASAENHLLKSVWPYARNVPDFSHAGHTTNSWGAWIDTGRLLPQFFPQFAAAKLERLVADLGLQAELDSLAGTRCPVGRRRYHAALYDALAGALLLLTLLRRPEFAAATIPWLLQMSTLDPERRGEMQQGDLF